VFELAPPNPWKRAWAAVLGSYPLCCVLACCPRPTCNAEICLSTRQAVADLVEKALQEKGTHLVSSGALATLTGAKAPISTSTTEGDDVVPRQLQRSGVQVVRNELAALTAQYTGGYQA